MPHLPQNKPPGDAKLQASTAEPARGFPTADVRPYLEVASGIYVILDLEGNVRFINRNGLAVLGYTDNEILDRNWFDRFLPKNVSDEARKRFQGVPTGESGAALSVECPIILKSGEERLVAWRISAIHNDGGNAIGTVLSGETVKDFQQREVSLKKQVDLLRTVIENIPEAVFVKDASARKVLANRADLVNMGLETEAEAQYKTDFDVFPEEIAARCYADDQTVLQTGQPVLNREEMLVNKSGQKRWLLTFKLPLRDEKGQIVGLFGMARDITEHKQTEKALLESELFLSAIFNSIQDGISVLTSDLTILHTNDVMRKWYSRNVPLEGKKCFECYHDALAACDSCPTLRCLETGKTERNIVPGLPGSPLEWLELFSYPMKNPETGKIFGVVEFVRDITERMRAQMALKESEERYRHLVNVLPDGVIIHCDGRIVFTNPAAMDIIGAEHQDQVVGKPVIEFVHPDFRAKVVKRIRQMVEKQAKVSLIQEKFIRLDGMTIDVDMAAVGFLYQGKPSVLTVIRDISDRKKAEEALRESERRFQALFVNAPDGINIFEVDLQNDGRRLVFCNDRYVEMSGYRREELFDRAEHIDDLFVYHPIADETPATAAELFNSGEVHRGTCSWKRPDGRENFYEYTAVPIRLEGKPHMIGIDRDITDRVLAEKNLKLTQFAVDHSMDTAFWMDSDGRLIYVNEAACQSLGYSCKKLLRMTIHEIDARFPKADWDGFWRDLKTRGSTILESHYKTKAGRVFPVEVRANFIAFGGKEYNCSFARDISLRKEMEAKIQADIREKEVLLKEIHHRVKNNMQVISSLLNLQSGLVKEEKYRLMFRESQARIRSMAIIHEQLYQTHNFAKIDFGTYVEQLTKELMQTFGAGKRGIRLKVQIPSVLLNINMAIPCGLIVNELVTNALKHAFPIKTTRIHSGKKAQNQILLRMAKNKGGWKLTVKDNGTGIPKKMDIQKCRSLGMKIVSALAGQLSGKIRIESKKGTAFHILFRDEALGQ